MLNLDDPRPVLGGDSQAINADGDEHGLSNPKSALCHV